MAENHPDRGQRGLPGGAPRYSAFALAKKAMNYHQDWQRAWRDPEPKAEYDAVIIGGGGHGLASSDDNSSPFWQAQMQNSAGHRPVIRVDRDLDDFVPSNPPFKLCKSHYSDSANAATGFAVTCCAFAEKSLAYQRHWVCSNRHDKIGFRLLMRRMSIEA